MAFLQNKLFCTFTQLENLELLLENLQNSYTILYNKMFILYIHDNDEYACTYNIEQGNLNGIPDNTILVHRKKESNSLYTINALNELIKSLNGGVLDSNYKINWNDYRNSILLTQQGNLKKLDTIVYKIISL
jgi:hypothetical protein